MGEVSLLERLRFCSQFKNDIFEEAADRIEDLEELLEIYECAMCLLKQREGYKRYVEYWRDKNGKSDLSYPDADEIYKEFWELKDGVHKLEKPL